MKKKVIYFIILFLAVILQTSILPVIFRSSAVGDVLLMLVLVGGLVDGFFGFFWWAIFAGILYDFVSYSTVGVHSIIFLLVVYSVSFFSRRFSVELKGIGIILFLAFVAASTVLSRLAIAIIDVLELQSPRDFSKYSGSPTIIGIQILYNIILFFLCFFVFKKVKIFFVID